MPDKVAVSSVNERDTVFAVLVAEENFDTLVVRVEVADVHSVAVFLLGRPEELAVIIEGAGAHADFLLAVVIEVCYHYVVVAAAVSRIVCIESGVIYPALHQLLVSYVKS